MILNIDLTIFVVFLAINLIVGLSYGRGITNIREYAIGNRNFSTATIAATVIATCVGGGFFSGGIAESYRQGLYFIIPAMGEPLALVIIGYFLAPRLAEFLGTLSVAEALGSIYGNFVRIIVAIASIFLCIGLVALQFKVSGVIFQLFFGFSGFYAVLAGATIVIIYSAFGGIRAVTFTDIIQFFTFGTIIPILSLIIWGTLSDPTKVFTTIIENPLFDHKEVFDIYNVRFINSVFLLLFFLVPCFQPVFFQRAMMARDPKQIRDSFSIAGGVCLVLLLVITWVGVLLLADKPDLDPNNLLAYIITNYGYPGLKGLTAIGIMSIIMSSADSYINSAAVLFTNDISNQLKLRRIIRYSDLNLSRFFSVFVGVIAFFLAFNASSILNLLLFVLSFYLPIVSGPLLLAIFGFRSTSKAILIGMVGGLTTVLMFPFLGTEELDPVIPGLFANIITILIAHYVLRQPGGWIGIKDESYLKAIRFERKKKFQNWLKATKEFNFLAFCRNNAPKQDYTYSVFGFFCIVSVFSTMYSIPKEIQQQHQHVLEFIYHSVLISSTILLTFPIWPLTFKKEKFIVVAWNILLPFTLIFTPTLLIIISNFGQFQLMIFLLNLVITSLLLRWQVALLMLVATVFVSVKFYKWHMGVDNLNDAIDVGLQFKIMYALLLVSSVLIALLKPKQEYQKLTEEKNEHLSERLGTQEKQLKEALALRSELIRNITHEFHAPTAGITAMAETLLNSYDKLSDEQRKIATELILKSSSRLETFDANITSLSKLNRNDYTLDIQSIDFSDLVYDRVKFCRKLYDNNIKDRDFILNIDENLKVEADKYYLTQVIDNLIINAISYCEKGKITVTLKEDSHHIIFTISDEGIGIPEDELHDIFNEFTVSTKTYTSSGGRGIGLALCKKVMLVHGGNIEAKSDGKSGAIFTLIMPK